MHRWRLRAPFFCFFFRLAGIFRIAAMIVRLIASTQLRAGAL
jgi:hypothetical protein